MKKTAIFFSLTLIILSISLVLCKPLTLCKVRFSEYSYNSFKKGNIAFLKDQYDVSINNYLDCIEDGVKTGSIFYNIANAYAKKGDLGKAILNYERSRAYMPSDDYLKINYALVKTNIKQDEQDTEIGSNFTYNQIYFVIISLLMLFVLFLGLSFFMGKHSFFCKLVAITLICCLATAVYMFESKYKKDKKRAIIVTKNENILEMPVLNSEIVGPLYEGNTVFVNNQIEGWYKVKKGMKRGWVQKKAIKFIYN